MTRGSYNAGYSARQSKRQTYNIKKAKQRPIRTMKQKEKYYMKLFKLLTVERRK